MAPVQAQRTLVKSPPELWAELSDLDCLARHLGEFGEIRITRLEPEQTVAWEGEHASGTVELRASGWGTRVTLTAELPETEAESVPVPEPIAVEPEPEPEPVAEEPEPEPEPAPVVTEMPVRMTFRARVRRWLRGPDIDFAPSAPPPAAPEPVAFEPPPPPPPEPEPEPVPASPEATNALAVLTAVLDYLGSAHHRPFSRG